MCRHADALRAQRGHTSVVQVLTVDDPDFPHAAQVARVVRHRTCLKTGKRSRETVYVITDLPSQQASPWYGGPPAPAS